MWDVVGKMWMMLCLCRRCCLDSKQAEMVQDEASGLEEDEDEDEDDDIGSGQEGMDWEDMMAVEDDLHDAYGYGYHSD